MSIFAKMYSAQKAKRSKANRETGFTLIELIVVIVVLGVLSGIAFFSVRGVREAGVVRACNENALQLLKAFEAYNIDKGYYPGNRSIGQSFSSFDVDELVVSGYIRNNFIQASPDYSLTSALSDGGAVVTGTFARPTTKTCKAP